MPPAAKNGMADAMPFFARLSQPLHRQRAAGEAVERIERRQIRLQRVHQLAAEQAAERVEHQVVHVAQAVRAAEQNNPVSCPSSINAENASDASATFPRSSPQT